MKTSNYQRGLADTEYLLAQYYKRTQKIDSALVYFESSAKRAEQENYNIGAAIAYNGLCRNLYLLAKYEDAESACKKALENIKSESDIEYMTKADTYTALGTIYSRQDLIEKAQENFLKVDSMHFLRPLRPDVIAAAYQNLGGIHLKFDDVTLAESYYKKANDQFKKLPVAAAEFYMSSNNVELGKLFLQRESLIRQIVY
ncbi:tetratricopeptide repeat protein [Maribacter halichondriae]|uniref:tetratricopeptide repeat protein n=1 Tax=Maribacter halichondriae TaxID=2980554 RepID=UPI002359073F|nr:tetratricopeptide repeat protein [Maribacter sp. Hal144]